MKVHINTVYAKLCLQPFVASRNDLDKLEEIMSAEEVPSCRSVAEKITIPVGCRIFLDGYMSKEHRIYVVGLTGEGCTPDEILEKHTITCMFIQRSESALMNIQNVQKAVDQLTDIRLSGRHVPTIDEFLSGWTPDAESSDSSQPVPDVADNIRKTEPPFEFEVLQTTESGSDTVTLTGKEIEALHGYTELLKAAAEVMKSEGIIRDSGVRLLGAIQENIDEILKRGN